MKPRLSSLVLATTAAGMWLAPGHAGPARWALALFSTAAVVGAANALNCWFERDSDRFMARTRTRPLPAGRMEPLPALIFGVALASLAIPALALGTNWLTGALALLAFCSYVLVYTPLKSRTEHAMLVGAVPGALPPLMGYTAATGRIALPGLALFAILFLWQLPHFLAIALFRKDEYRRAGLASVPLRQGDDAARAQAMTYLVLLWPVSFLPYAAHAAGKGYLACAVALGAGFLALGVYGWASRAGPKWARRLFFASLAYLPVLLAALALDARR